MKNFNQLAKKKLLKIFLSSMQTKVAIKFPKKLFFFFLPKIGLALKGLMSQERPRHLTLSRPLDVPVRLTPRSRLWSCLNISFMT